MRSFTERSRKTNATSMGSVHGLSDQSLVDATKRGHSMAFAALSERYRPQLFRAALRITRNCQDTEDAVQDALLRSFVHIAHFDGRSSFGTWLTRIAINSALMILRKKRASLEITTDHNDELSADGVRYEITDHEPNPEMRYAQSEEENILMKAIQNLRPTLRIVVQIQQLQERSMRETAEAIGVSLTAAKGRLFHAKNALRRSMIPRLVHQPRVGRHGANARTRFDDQHLSNEKEQGDQHVIDNKEKRNYRAPSNLHPGGPDGTGFSKEISA